MIRNITCCETEKHLNEYMISISSLHRIKMFAYVPRKEHDRSKGVPENMIYGPVDMRTNGI